MTTLKRCIEFLDNNDIPYAHTRHANAYRARDVAAAEHLPACRLAKTVVFSSDDGYGMAVLPADCLLDLEEVAANAREHLQPILGGHAGAAQIKASDQHTRRLEPHVL